MKAYETKLQVADQVIKLVSNVLFDPTRFFEESDSDQICGILSDRFAMRNTQIPHNATRCFPVGLQTEWLAQAFRPFRRSQFFVHSSFAAFPTDCPQKGKFAR